MISAVFFRIDWKNVNLEVMLLLTPHCKRLDLVWLFKYYFIIFNLYMPTDIVRNNWNKHEVLDLYQLPFNDLLYLAHRIFREHHDPNKVQVSTLLSVKTGSCSEDCAYCPQSGHYDTNVEKERLLALEEVREHAEAAKQNGASRFCMGAAWRNPSDKNLEQIVQMIKLVKQLELETCVSPTQRG